MNDPAVTIRLDAAGRIELAFVAVRGSQDAYRGYVMNAREDALFEIARDARGIVLKATAGEAAWSRSWSIAAQENAIFRAVSPVEPIAQAEYEELAALAQQFVARWIWFKSGPHEEVAIEAQRFAAMGCAIDDANVRSAALTRIRNGASPALYSELEPADAWITEAIARCWPGGG